MDKLAYSIPQFAQSVNVSRSGFYKALREGWAPPVTKFGSRSLITHEHRSLWLEKLSIGGKEAVREWLATLSQKEAAHV